MEASRLRYTACIYVYKRESSITDNEKIRGLTVMNIMVYNNNFKTTQCLDFESGTDASIPSKIGKTFFILRGLLLGQQNYCVRSNPIGELEHLEGNFYNGIYRVQCICCCKLTCLSFLHFLLTCSAKERTSKVMQYTILFLKEILASKITRQSRTIN